MDLTANCLWGFCALLKIKIENVLRQTCMVRFVFNWLISEDQGANLNRRKAFEVLLFIYFNKGEN